MNIFGTLAGWAKSAFGFVTGLPGDAGKAVSGLWHYATSIHNVLSWLVSNPLLRFEKRALENLSAFHLAQVAVLAALHRLAGWLWLTMVRPVRDALNRQIARLRAWTAVQLADLARTVLRLYLASLAYTRAQVGAERSSRIAADYREHDAMIKAVRAALAEVQREASSGYNSGLRQRISVVERLVDDIAARQPEVKALTATLVRAVVDLETIDNPVARLLVGRLLSEVIAKLGVDRVIGDLAGRLIGSLTGAARPHDLYSVARDIGERITALEDQWAAFMDHGGPEVEQAGDEWKALTGVVGNAALLAWVGLGVADPQAWAASVADTIGVAGNDALTGIFELINRA